MKHHVCVAIGVSRANNAGKEYGVPTVEFERSVLDVYIEDNLGDKGDGENEQDGMIGRGILQEQGGGRGEHDPDNSADAGPNGKEGADVSVFGLVFLDPAQEHRPHIKKCKRDPCAGRSF